MLLKYYRVSGNSMEHPKRATASSACFDLVADIKGRKVKKMTRNGIPREIECEDEIIIGHGERVLVPCGLIFDIPAGHSLRIHPRSGMAWKHGITMANAEGVVDEDYVEETMVLLMNTSDSPYYIKHGDRIAQAEIVVDCRMGMMEIESRPTQKTDRNGGFGSTGK